MCVSVSLHTSTYEAGKDYTGLKFCRRPACSIPERLIGIFEFFRLSFVVNPGEKMKIGYVPYSNDLSQTADRRRFPYFANRYNIPYELASRPGQYDLLILNASADLTAWWRFKELHPRVKVLFEMVDSLIFSANDFDYLFKGVGRFLLGKETRPAFIYQTVIWKWLKNADFVLCSSTEVANRIKELNPNVLVSLDYLETEYPKVKYNYEISSPVKLLWEGQAIVLRQFLHFKKLLRSLSEKCELHVITSETYSMLGKFKWQSTNRLLKELPIKTTFHPWNLQENAKIFSTCDVGMIPINPKNTFGWHKPANKLISFWFSGIPTLVSDTPAYTEMMTAAGEHWFCNSTETWLSKLDELLNLTSQQRKDLASKNLEFAEANFSDNVLDKVWCRALAFFGINFPKETATSFL